MTFRINQLQRSSPEQSAAAATEEKRQCIINSSNSSVELALPLDKDEMLDHVCYVGGGDHLYVAGVNRSWRGRYMQCCALHGKTKCTR
jgi:hypothetical protein